MSTLTEETPIQGAVYVIATLDTKGAEAAYLVHLLQAQNLPVVLVDVGCLGEPQVPPDIPREVLFAAADYSWADLRRRADRGESVAAAAEGATRLVLNHAQQGRVSGVLGLGGSAGTTIASAAMRQLPLAIPKVLVSTLAAGDVASFVGSKNIALVYSVVDLAGLNRITRTVLAQAAAMMAGAVRWGLGAPSAPSAPPLVARLGDGHAGDRPLIGATMFGVTTPCVDHARQLLEQHGFEVLVFHATGTGGRTLESLIEEGLLAGVLDITTTELADELVGGVMSAGSHRLTMAAQTGTPQVVSVGATDMVNFWDFESVPAPFRDRQLYRHNPHVTLMRTTAAECREIGSRIGQRLRAAPRSTHLLLPTEGVSALDRTGQVFDDPLARQELFEAIGRQAGDVPVEIVPWHINEPAFAELAVRRLLEKIAAKTETS